MAIDPVSQNQQQFQLVRNDFQSLSQALKTGNLSAAQSAYTSLQQDQQGGPQPPAGSPAAAAFDQLGQALQSGDLSGAQQAFSSIQTDMQSARKAHGSHRGGGGGGQDSDSSSASSSTDNSQKTVQSTISATNANGTITVTTTYTDGSTSTTTEPNPTPVVSNSPLAASGDQLAVLLNAQQQANG